MIEALLLVVLVVGGLSLLGLWARDFADLLWMFIARRLLVSLTTLILLAIVLVIVSLVSGLSPSSATSFGIAILVTPTLAKWVANAIARRRAGSASREVGPLSGFIFAQERAAQTEAYEAPRVAQ
jgi:hypothetical protein